MIRCGSVLAAQCVVGGGSGTHAVVCVDSLAALAVSMAIYGDICCVADERSNVQGVGAAKTKRRGLHFACRKRLEHIGPADGFGLRRGAQVFCAWSRCQFLSASLLLLRTVVLA